MANKKILEIEVNDTQCQKLLEDFKEFQATLDAMPGDWKQLGVAIGGAAGAGTKALENTATTLERATVLQHRFATATRQTGHAMSTLASNAKAALGHIAGMAKLTALGALGLGGAGLFGMDRLAQAVFGQRRTALGLGVSTGEQAAFRTNFGQFVDPDSLLGNVANARNDLSKQYAFRALGIGAGEEAGQDNADLSTDVMRRARQMWRRGPQTQQYAQAMGLSEFFSMEDLRRLGAMSDQDAARAASGFSRDRTSMAVPDDVQRQWVQFSTQLRRAGIQIETTFVRNLGQLTPGLEHLSVGLTHVVEAFFDSKGIKTAIDNLGKWIDSPEIKTAIKDFGDYLGSPKFMADLRTFADNVSLVAEGTVNALRWLGLIPSTAEADAAQRRTVEQGAKSPDAVERAESRMQLLTGPPPSDDAMRKMFGDAGAKYGVPPDLLWNLYGAETDHGRGSRISPKGALGLMQLMPDTAKQLGVDPLIPEQAAMGSAHMLNDMQRKYGDWRKAVAAYNWGAGNLDADIAAHGKEWEKFAPPETQKELARVFPAGGGIGGGSDLTRAMDKLRRQMASRSTQPQVNVTVSSDVAARVALSGLQAAH